MEKMRVSCKVLKLTVNSRSDFDSEVLLKKSIFAVPAKIIEIEAKIIEIEAVCQGKQVTRRLSRYRFICQLDVIGKMIEMVPHNRFLVWILRCNLRIGYSK